MEEVCPISIFSPFINDLPNKKDTVNFSTEDASGSTSQAANVVEAVQSGAKCLLIDEDTCATNFMVRDELMQAVVSGEQEPITPFTLQARNLYEKQGISIILVAGSSGSYFYIADHVLQMDNYRTYDITDKVKKSELSVNVRTDEKKVPVDVAVLFDKKKHRNLRAGKMEKKRDQVKIKQFGKDSFSIGRENVDLKYVEQILDSEQTTALAYCLKNLLEEMERKEQDVDICVEKLWDQIQKQGLASLCGGKLSFCIDGTNPEAGYIRVSEQISGIYWIRGKNLEEKIREEMEESFKCIIGGNDGWKPWNECICRRYVGK